MLKQLLFLSAFCGLSAAYAAINENIPVVLKDHFSESPFKAFIETLEKEGFDINQIPVVNKEPVGMTGYMDLTDLSTFVKAGKPYFWGVDEYNRPYLSILIHRGAPGTACNQHILMGLTFFQRYSDSKHPWAIATSHRIGSHKAPSYIPWSSTMSSKDFEEIASLLLGKKVSRPSFFADKEQGYEVCLAEDTIESMLEDKTEL